MTPERLYQGYGTTWADVLRADPCCWCNRRTADATVDHVYPKSQFERRALLAGVGQTVGACRECNNARGGRSALWFLIVRAQMFGVMPRSRSPYKLSPGRRWAA